MKAYKLSVNNDSDQGEEIVFAKNGKEARGKYEFLEPENFIDLSVRRAPEFDGMENADAYELAKRQWQTGWRWFDLQGMPDPDEDTEEDFEEWYKEKLK